MLWKSVTSRTTEAPGRKRWGLQRLRAAWEAGRGGRCQTLPNSRSGRRCRRAGVREHRRKRDVKRDRSRRLTMRAAEECSDWQERGSSRSGGGSKSGAAQCTQGDVEASLVQLRWGIVSGQLRHWQRQYPTRSGLGLCLDVWASLECPLLPSDAVAWPACGWWAESRLVVSAASVANAVCAFEDAFSPHYSPQRRLPDQRFRILGKRFRLLWGNEVKRRPGVHPVLTGQAA